MAACAETCRLTGRCRCCSANDGVTDISYSNSRMPVSGSSFVAAIGAKVAATVTTRLPHVTLTDESMAEVVRKVATSELQPGRLTDDCMSTFSQQITSEVQTTLEEMKNLARRKGRARLFTEIILDSVTDLLHLADVIKGEASQEGHPDGFTEKLARDLVGLIAVLDALKKLNGLRTRRVIWAANQR